MGVIYKWTCKLNNKSYIGQTVNENARYKSHKKCLGNYHGKNHFHCALNKYSNEEDWDYSIIEDNVPVEKLNERECFWISFYDSARNGYNSTYGGGQMIFTEDVKRKMSETRKGRIPWNKGIKMSDKFRETCSKAFKGRKYSEATRRRIGEGRKKWKLSEESVNKIKEKLTGKKLSPEHLANVRAANKLKPSCKGRHRVYNDPNDHSKGWKMVY